MSKSIVIFGYHAIQAQLDSAPECLLKIYALSQREDDRLKTLLQTVNKVGLPLQFCNKAQLEKLTKNQTHQGIAAEILLPNLPNQDAILPFLSTCKKPYLILVLDSIQDPRNLGACLRSANAFGVDCIIINKDGSAPINALVHKTSAGALNQLKIFQVTNLSRTLKSLQKNNVWVYGLDGNCNTNLNQVDLTSSSALVMGSEGTGLRSLIKKSCDQLLKIPMQGNVESLNISVATGISLFEVSRQRN
jgi:23S rRNA (guanosine2251-2'-O)-methyltransferase